MDDALSRSGKKCPIYFRRIRTVDEDPVLHEIALGGRQPKKPALLAVRYIFRITGRPTHGLHRLGHQLGVPFVRPGHASGPAENPHPALGAARTGLAAIQALRPGLPCEARR